MTKVELYFQLNQPLTDAVAERIADAHKIYGMIRVQLMPDMTALRVAYDATRMTPADVASALARNGIPAIPA